MASQSQLTKNGQQLKVPSGAGAVASGDIVLVGGPGNEAWSAGTADYAAIPAAGSVLAATSVVSSRMPGSSRQPVARDRLGNVYLIGTNSSGNLVAYKFSPLGSQIAQATLDGTATSVNTAQVFQLQSGAYAAVYARAAGALMFVIFDSNLNLVAGPSSVATEYASTNVVYHASCALSGGGFAVAYQTSAGTNVAFATFGNTGSSVVVATNIQALASTTAQMFLKMAQLSSGNLVIGYRGTMTVGGTAGTGFLIVTTAGAVVSPTPVSTDSTSTAGFIELSVLVGFFAIAVANGSNLIAKVYSNAGTAQGSGYSVGDTLNSTAYPQVKLVNDTVQFWLLWFSSAGNGVFVVSMSTAGTAPVTSASGLGASTLSASTFALDAEIVNGLIVGIAASNGTAGQFYFSVGLPDASLGVILPYLRTPPTVLGSPAATTGSSWPRVLSSGGGLYQGTSPPTSQPLTSPYNGDFTAIFAYDQANVAATVIAIQKLESSAIIGMSLAVGSPGVPGTALLVNPGPGEYPSNPLAGTNGYQFNHIGLNPSGTAGALYSDGVGLTGMLNGPFSSTGSSNWATGDLKRTLSNPSNLIPQAGWLYMTLGTIGNAGSGATLRANADVQPIYTVMYNTFNDTICPVTGGRGASAAADFSAGKPLAMIDSRGMVLAAAENNGTTGFSGNLGNNASVGGFSGNATLGLTAGEKAHVQTVPELVSHHHSYNVPNAAAAASGGGAVSAPSPTTTGDTGGGGAANVTQPTLVTYLLIKL